PLSGCHGDSREDPNVRLLWTSSCEGFLHDSREDVDTGLRPRPPEHSPRFRFEWAQLAENAGDIAEAERLYRVLMKCDPTDAVPLFDLGNMVRANGRKIEAKVALRAATRADPMFAESLVDATFNLALLYGELVGTRKRRNTGGNILPTMLNLNGQHAHVIHEILRNANSSVSLPRSC